MARGKPYLVTLEAAISQKANLRLFRLSAGDVFTAIDIIHLDTNAYNTRDVGMFFTGDLS